MTINRALHLRANVARLYLPRNEGGRGLRSSEETVRTEEHGLSYIRCEEKGSNRLLKKLIKEKTKREYQENQRATKEKESLYLHRKHLVKA